MLRKIGMGAGLAYYVYKTYRRLQGVVKEPGVGDILCCDLLGDLMEHSGIYVGKCGIVELCSNGEVCQTTPQGFLNKASYKGIYVLSRCAKTGEKNSKGEEYVQIIGGLEYVAKRALESVGKRLDYRITAGLERYNCHKFVCDCLLEGAIKGKEWRLKDIKKTLYEIMQQKHQLKESDLGFYEWDIQI
ncbi:hypothetical protein [Helicobacter suis]|uniref:hypothetical protein n=1 Tax=Helicobacter suis TaxID=104628 RepID=UPI001F080524|nr:hypothetical protein [Helicobacter suis]